MNTLPYPQNQPSIQKIYAHTFDEAFKIKGNDGSPISGLVLMEGETGTGKTSSITSKRNQVLSIADYIHQHNHQMIYTAMTFDLLHQFREGLTKDSYIPHTIIYSKTDTVKKIIKQEFFDHELRDNGVYYYNKQLGDYEKVSLSDAKSPNRKKNNTVIIPRVDEHIELLVNSFDYDSLYAIYTKHVNEASNTTPLKNKQDFKENTLSLFKAIEAGYRKRDPDMESIRDKSSVFENLFYSLIGAVNFLKDLEKLSDAERSVIYHIYDILYTDPLMIRLLPALSFKYHNQYFLLLTAAKFSRKFFDGHSYLSSYNSQPANYVLFLDEIDSYKNILLSNSQINSVSRDMVMMCGQLLGEVKGICNKNLKYSYNDNLIRNQILIDIFNSINLSELLTDSIVDFFGISETTKLSELYDLMFPNRAVVSVSSEVMNKININAEAFKDNKDKDKEVGFSFSMVKQGGVLSSNDRNIREYVITRSNDSYLLDYRHNVDINTPVLSVNQFFDFINRLITLIVTQVKDSGNHQNRHDLKVADFFIDQYVSPHDNRNSKSELATNIRRLDYRTYVNDISRDMKESELKTSDDIFYLSSHISWLIEQNQLVTTKGEFGDDLLAKNQKIMASPEAQMIKLCQANLVYGLSATSFIPSVLANLNFPFIKDTLIKLNNSKSKPSCYIPTDDDVENIIKPQLKQLTAYKTGLRNVEVAVNFYQDRINKKNVEYPSAYGSTASENTTSAILQEFCDELQPSDYCRDLSIYSQKELMSKSNYYNMRIIRFIHSLFEATNHHSTLAYCTTFEQIRGLLYKNSRNRKSKGYLSNSDSKPLSKKLESIGIYRDEATYDTINNEIVKQLQANKTKKDLDELDYPDFDDCLYTFTINNKKVVILLLNAQYYRGTGYKELFDYVLKMPNTTVYVLTQIASAARGKNFDHENEYGARKDFDHIAILELTHFFINIDPSLSPEDIVIVRNSLSYLMNELYLHRYISHRDRSRFMYEFLKTNELSIKNQTNTGCDPNREYKAGFGNKIKSDVNYTLMALLIQIVGRGERTWEQAGRLTISIYQTINQRSNYNIVQLLSNYYNDRNFKDNEFNISFANKMLLKQANDIFNSESESIDNFPMDLFRDESDPNLHDYNATEAQKSYAYAFNLSEWVVKCLNEVRNNHALYDDFQKVYEQLRRALWRNDFKAEINIDAVHKKFPKGREIFKDKQIVLEKMYLCLESGYFENNSLHYTHNGRNTDSRDSYAFYKSSNEKTRFYCPSQIRSKYGRFLELTDKRHSSLLKEFKWRQDNYSQIDNTAMLHPFAFNTFVKGILGEMLLETAFKEYCFRKFTSWNDHAFTIDYKPVNHKCLEIYDLVISNQNTPTRFRLDAKFWNNNTVRSAYKDALELKNSSNTNDFLKLLKYKIDTIKQYEVDNPVLLVVNTNMDSTEEKLIAVNTSFEFVSFDLTQDKIQDDICFVFIPQCLNEDNELNTKLTRIFDMIINDEFRGGKNDY